MGQIIWAPKASRDLSSVFAFIEQDSKKYASIVVNEMLQEVRTLLVQPGKGKIVPEFRNPVIRELKIYSYRVIYQILDNSDIAVVKIWHQSRLLNKL